jgi:hypothetical protein
MRIRVKITDLDEVQWAELHQMVPAGGYDFIEGMTRVCVVFELATQTERHVEMPLMVFSKVVARLAHVGHAPTVDAAWHGTQSVGRALRPDPIQPERTARQKVRDKLLERGLIGPSNVVEHL